MASCWWRAPASTRRVFLHLGWRSIATCTKPVAPMLATPVNDLTTVPRRFPHGYFIEVKYDGERVQIHKRNSQLSFFSRSLKSMSCAKTERLLPQLEHCLGTQHDVVLDGEIMLADKTTRHPLPFGALGRKQQLVHTNGTPSIVLFDVLSIDGQNTQHFPLSQRRQMLEQMLKPENPSLEGFVMLSQLVRAKSITDLEHMKQQVLQEGLEGMMIKDAQGPYEPGKRGWLKFKPDMITGLVDTLDLVVVGGYRGSGKFSHLISSFLCAVRDDTDTSTTDTTNTNNTNTNTQPLCFRTVCKVGIGFTYDQLVAINSKIQFIEYSKSANARGNTSPPPPTTLTQPSTPTASNLPWLALPQRCAPDVIVADVESCEVWTVLGSQLLLSRNTIHTSGISLRFPRLVRPRLDKTVAQATTLSQLRHFLEIQQAKQK